ncbi:hypothetical protein POTOM_045731 [Populus tomentosa]|uniref:Uncharacterized protein n=1 Tax=Populus tomentosa TaxID=118781 RepID=A0A8X7YKE0_POPTO|nr:hypothetical protein POTOM_045731 [Populus tomentosa]
MATKINHQISPNSGPTELQLKSILIITFTTGMFLNLLPQENIDGNPVPTVIFKGHASIFHAFVISVIFAFTGSFCSLMIDKKPKIVSSGVFRGRSRSWLNKKIESRHPQGPALCVKSLSLASCGLCGN